MSEVYTPEMIEMFSTIVDMLGKLEKKNDRDILVVAIFWWWVAKLRLERE